MFQPTVTPVYNPSLALIPQGWPYSQVNGSGMIGNNASHEIEANEQPSSADAAKIQAVKVANSAGTSGRIV